MPPPPGWGGPRWLVGRLASGVGARLHTRSGPLGAVPGRFVRGLVRCPACGCVPVISGGGVYNFCPQGDVIALEVCLAGHCEGCATCMVVSWLQVAARGSRRCVRVGGTPAGVSARRRSPVGRALGHVGCGCPGFRLRVGSRWALCRCLSRCGVPRRACIAAVCWGRGWGGARVTRGLRPVGGWWGEAGGVFGVWRWFPKSRTGPDRVRCLAASACRHVRRAIGRMLACGFFGWPVIPLGISARGGPRATRSAAGSGASFRCGGPTASSVASTVGSSRCGWGGGAGGVAASSASCVAARVRPSGTGARLNWPPTWPVSARKPPSPSAAAGLAAGFSPSGFGTPVGSSRPGSFTRGASAGTVACVGSGSGSGLEAG